MGVFINVDGTNGSGKSRMVYSVSKELEDKGYTVKTTREPGGTEIGSKIRDILLDEKYNNLDIIAETLLFFADRAQHYKEILSKKDEYDILITDRFVSSTYIYQHWIKNVEREFLDDLYNKTLRGLKPDLSIYMISDYPHNKVGMGEIKGDRFDEESFGQRNKIIEGFKRLDIGEHDKKLVYTNNQEWDDYREYILDSIIKIHNLYGRG